MTQRLTVAASAVTPVDYRRRAVAEAQALGLNPDLVLKVIAAESNWDPKATSPKGAIGLMQLLPDTARELGVNPANPTENLRGGVRYLKSLLDRYNGDERLALAAYNAGPGNVDKHGGVPPFAETQAYVTKILGAPQQATTPAGRVTVSPDAVRRITVNPADVQRTTPPARPQPTASSARPTFGQGLKETLLPDLGALKMIAETIAAKPGELNVFGLSPRGIGSTAVALARGMLGEHWAQAGRAVEAGREALNAPLGSTAQIAAASEAVGHAAFTGVPILGPMLGKAAEDVQAGDYGYAAGQLTGIAAPFGASKVLRTVRAARPTGPIPLTRGERTGSSLSRFAETLTEKTIPGRTAFQRFRARQQEALIKATEEAVERVSTLTGMPGEAYRIGERVIQALEDAKKAFIRPISNAYDEIARLTETQTRRVPKVSEVPSAAGLVDEFGKPVSVPKRTMEKVDVGGLQPETRGLKQFAAPLLRRIREEAKLIPPEQLKPAMDGLSRILSAPKRMPYRAFQDARSDLLAIARRHGDPIPGKAGGLAKKLAALTDEAMETAANQSGILVDTADGPLPLQQFIRQTNALWAEAEDTFNQSILSKMAETAPERIPLLLEQASLDDIAKFKKFAPDRQVRESRAKLLESWLRGDVQGEAMVPGVQGLPEATAGPSMRGSQFRTRLERFGRDRAAALFGQRELQELLSLAKVAEQFSKGRGDAAAGLIAGGINASMIAAGPVALAGLAFGNLGAAASAVGLAGAQAGAFRIAAKLMTSPEGLVGLRKYVRALGTGHLPEVTLAAKELARIYAEQTTEPIGGPPTPMSLQLDPNRLGQVPGGPPAPTSIPQ